MNCFYITGEIPLFIALKSHQFSIAVMLINHGADINQQFGAMTAAKASAENDHVRTKQPLLHHLLDAQDVEAVNFMLKYPELDMSTTSE